MLQKRLSTICQELGIARPTLSPEKTYTLSITPKISLLLREVEQGFSLSGIIAPCPQKEREELFLYLMRANFLGQGTGGSRIGLDRDEKFLTLFCSFPYEMNDQDFRDKVEEFANYLLYWRDHLEKQ